MQRLPLATATVLAIVVAVPPIARGDIDAPSSIVVYPKIIADGSRDTMIHLSNTSTSVTSVSCYYVNAAPLNPDLPPNPITNPPLWQIIDFELTLTARQPTIWLASLGRTDDATDPPCSRIGGDFECYGAGFDPGIIPPVPAGFVGELVCVETDPSGNPIAGNHFTGAATIKDISTGDVSRYRAIGSQGNELNDGDDVLCLGGAPSGQCPGGAEYSGCPQAWLLDVRAEGSEIDGVPGSALSTEITVVPCARDYESQAPETVTFQYAVHNEFEQQFSASQSVTCWGNQSLSEDIWDYSVLGTATARTSIRPTSNSGGFVIVAEEHGAIGTSGPSAAAALNAHAEGERPGGDVIRLEPTL